MNTWLIVRLTLVGFSFLQGALSSQAVAPPEGVSLPVLAAIFGFSIVGMLFVVGIQSINPRSAPQWRYPSWSINPFLLHEPLQFFHFGAFSCIADSVGSGLRMLVLGQSPQLSILFLPAFGVGILTGVHICAFVYRSKMVSAQPGASE